MKNKFLFLLAITCVITVSSCKKKIESCKLGKSYSSDGNTTPRPNTFYYYSDGRLQKIEYGNKTKDTLAYRADTIEVLSFDAGGLLSTTFTGTINGSGHVIAGTKAFYDLSGNILSTEDYAMSYNAEGNLTQQVVTHPLTSDILQFYYTAGNADSGVLFVASVPEKRYVFFRGSAENKTGIDDLKGVFVPYFGKSSKNLLDSTYVISATSDTTRIQYAHTLDENDYVSRTIQTYLNSGVETKYLTYQYFDCSK
ncbi:MAG: hypothetical protein V4615_07730 [Bacteroidota bacterium]